jgi:hypothetical protein
VPQKAPAPGARSGRRPLKPPRGAPPPAPPPPPSAPGRRPLAAAVRGGAAALALALALLPIVRQHALVARQEQMAAWLGEGGVAVPRELEHEPDAGRVVLRAARAALAAELDPARRSDLPAAEEARQHADAAARMAETARLAAEVLADRPAAWEAAMVMGTATYRSWSLARDTHLFTAAARWEDPLSTAMSLAPGRQDSSRLLAGIYLELWPQLSAAKRERERRLLAGVFSDPPSAAGLIAPWLATAGSRAEAFSVMPPVPAVWERLEQIYAQEADWQGYCAARERWDLALYKQLAARLAEAEARSAEPEARELFLEVATEARPGRRYLDLLTRALEGCPPGSVGRQTAQRLNRQLVWTLERCRLERCPLTAQARRRLAGLSRDLDPRIDAMAALVNGDLPRAEVLERTYATSWSDDWAAYRLLKVKTLVERGHAPEATAEATAALAAMPRSWLARPSYWQMRAAAARAAADPAAESAAARELARLAAREWPATAWDFHDGAARLELLAAADSTGLQITVDAAPPRGAAAEIRLDESILGTFPVAAGATLALDAPVTPGPHLLEIESVAGGALVPGAVRLTHRDRGWGGEPR